MKHTFEYIEFTDDLKLGIDSIDNQHKEIVRIYNMFITEINHIIVLDKNNDGMITSKDVSKIAEDVENIMESLTDYVMYHFYEEEKFMRSINYSKYTQHVHSHADIKEEIAFYKEELNRNNFDVLEFVEFFYDWIVGHIKKGDIDYINEYKEYKKSHPNYTFESSTFK